MMWIDKWTLCADIKCAVKSLALGRCGGDFESVNFDYTLWIKFISLMWMPEIFFVAKSTLVQVMAWCRQVHPDLSRHDITIGHSELNNRVACFNQHIHFSDYIILEAYYPLLFEFCANRSGHG